jgi:hypothetical protein
MLCASIIFPITPPELLDAAMSTGLSPSCSAVIFCKPPNSTLEDVSDPVSATASQPIERAEERIEPARVRPVAAGCAPSNPKMASLSASTKASIPRTRLLSSTQSSRHSGNSVDCPRSAPQMRRFIISPRNLRGVS